MGHKIHLHYHQTAVKKNLFHHVNLLTGDRKILQKDTVLSVLLPER